MTGQSRRRAADFEGQSDGVVGPAVSLVPFRPIGG